MAELAEELVAEDCLALPQERIERTEDLVEIRRLFSKLKPEERIAMVLLGLGYSYREIGELRGWTKTKVNRSIAEGREKIRAEINDQGGGS